MPTPIPLAERRNFLMKENLLGRPTALVAMALSQLFACPAYSAPAISEHAAGQASSGGPLMTIDTVKGNVVDGIWTDPNGQTGEATFPAKVLQQF